MTKRSALYKAAVEWIAANDEPTLVDVADVPTIAELVSVAMTADIHGTDPEVVALDVLHERIKANRT